MGSSDLGHEAALRNSLVGDPVQEKQRRLKRAESRTRGLPQVLNAGKNGQSGAAVLTRAGVAPSRERESKLRLRTRTVEAKPRKNDDAMRMYVLTTAS